MTLPLVSVIVPVFNCERYLRQCVRSILCQTLPSLELILIDDGSTDKSGEICDEYGKADKRVRVFHMENGGVSRARNFGLSLSRGDYIGFVDSDDWISPSMYEALYRQIFADRSDIAMCRYQDANNEQLSSERAAVWKIMNRTDALIDVIKPGGYEGFVWNKLFSRNLFCKGGGELRFDEQISVCEDLLLLCQLISRCEKISCTSAPFYKYRQRRNSASNFVSEKSFNGLQVKRKLFPLYDKFGLYDAYAAYAYDAAYLLSFYHCQIIRDHYGYLEQIIKKYGNCFWKVKYPLKERAVMYVAAVNPKLFGETAAMVRKVLR